MSVLEQRLREMRTYAGSAMKTRLQGEMEYARRVSLVHDGEYDDLIHTALDETARAVKENGALTDQAVLSVEKILMPMQEDCKKYSLLMVGHAHIDMNWMWRYDETVSITLDTFRTALNLMNEFPTFTFAQSQASVYRIVEQFEPAMIEEIKEKIKAGQWEVSASTWVEADRNMPSAESVARHFLYTKRYLPALLGIDGAALDLDFEPDTFGHGENVPEMLVNAGMKFYYHCRGEEEAILYRWRSPSGAEILVYREPFWYLGPIHENMAEFVPEFCEKYGMTTAMRVYGVGDHGGGPTRRDVERILDMGSWPIYPRVECGTYNAFYQAADAARANFPVLEGERNFIFTGCYTTQTRIKMGNRMGEKLMMEAEAFSAFANTDEGAEYDKKAFEAGWRNILFNQFHDIIPGSGVADTREHAMALYQESYAIANTAKRAALTAITAAIDTSGFLPSEKGGGTAEGAGVGFMVYPFKLGQVERGGGNTTRIFHVFNPVPFARKSIAEVILWDFRADFDRIEVIDSAGNVVRHQLLDQRYHEYWQHDWARLAIEADLPSMGYQTFGIRLKADLEPKNPYMGDVRKHVPFDGVLENELIRARFDTATGALVSLLDKKTGAEMLSGEGARFRYILESTDQGMTSWTVGRYMHIAPLTDNVTITRVQSGGLVNALSFEQQFRGSSLKYTVTLEEGSEALNYDVSVNWIEVGTRETGIPQLNFGVALSKEYDRFIYDVPGGMLDRPSCEMDMPSQGMMAAQGGLQYKALLMSDCKYGFRGDKSGMSVTLIRSSYDPDPFPELGAHTFRIAVGFSHAKDDAELLRQVQAWNHLPVAVSGSNHTGTKGLTKSFMDVVSGDFMLSAVKLSEEGSALILRGMEVEGQAQEIEIAFSADVKSACFADTMEKPVAGKIEVSGNRIRFAVGANRQFALKVEM